MTEMRQNLWTDFFGPPAKDGANLRRDFAVVRRGGQPLLYLPVGRAAAQALVLYPAQSSKARLAKWLLSLGLRYAPPKLLGLEVFSQRFPPGDAFGSFLCAAGSRDASLPLFGVLRGNPNVAGRRDVFLLFNRVQQPVAVVKAGQGEAACKLIAHEESLLASLPSDVAGVPRVGSRFATASARAFAMDFYPGSSPTGDPTPQLARLLGSWLDYYSGELPLADLPAWQRLLAASAREPLPEPVLALGKLRVRPAIMHGDLAPWNAKVAHGQWTVLDWERGERVGVPGWDWFHFVMQPAVLVRRESTESLLSRFERLLASTEFLNYAKRASLHEHTRALALAYLATCTRVTRQTEGRERLSELEHAAVARWFAGRR